MKLSRLYKDDVLGHRLALAAYCLPELNEASIKDPLINHKWDEIVADSLNELKYQNAPDLASKLPLLLETSTVFSRTRLELSQDKMFPFDAILYGASHNSVIASMPETLKLIADILRLDFSLHVLPPTWVCACQAVINLGATAATPEILTALAFIFSGGDQHSKINSSENELRGNYNQNRIRSHKRMLNRISHNHQKDILKAIGKIGSAAATPEILSTLAIKLLDKNKNIQNLVIEVTGKIGAKASTPEFLAALGDLLCNENTAWVATKVILKLGKSAATPEILTGLARILRDGNEDLKRIAVQAIGEIGEQAATKEILEDFAIMLQGENNSVKLIIANAIFKIGAVTTTPEFLMSLTNILFYGDNETKRIAIKIIGSLGRDTAKPVMLNALVSMLYSRDTETKQIALKAISKIGPAAATPEILTAIANLFVVSNDDMAQRVIKAIKDLGNIVESTDFLS